LFAGTDIGPQVIEKQRLTNILVVAPELSASLALVASYPFGELERQGILNLRVCIASAANATDLAWCDILFAVRPANAASAILISAAKRAKRIVMCHWDDNLLCIPPESNSYAYFSRPGVRKLTVSGLRSADVVLTSSPKLAQQLRSLLEPPNDTHTPVIVLPVPAINIQSDIRSKINESADPITAPFIVGYAGSPDQTKILQQLVVPALEILWSSGHNIYLRLIGPRLAIDPQWQKFVTESPTTIDYAEWLNTRNNLAWDLAIAPLNESLFNQCKYFNKYIEFGAAGIPCLFSDVAPYNTVVAHGSTGLLVSNAITAWADAILTMKNQRFRTQIAQQALDHIRTKHDLTVVAVETHHLLAPWLDYRAPTVKPPAGIGFYKLIKWIHTNLIRRRF
jgi:glycosyltransferase involved in cell wall biosynthesis